MLPWTAILAGLGAYLLVGVGVGAAFVAFGVQRIDPAARGAPWAFRLLILPGAAAMWPMMVARWVRGVSPPAPADPGRARIERVRRWQDGIAGRVLVALVLLAVLVLSAMEASP